MKQLLQYIQYDTYKWNICAHLKVIALLLGLQLGYTKFPCFLCEWDSRDKTHHYVRRIWHARKTLEPGHKNVKHHSLVESSRILLPPLKKPTHTHTPTHYKTHTYTHTHTLQKPHIPTHYKTHIYTHTHTHKHTHITKTTHIHTPIHYKTHTYTHTHTL